MIIEVIRYAITAGEEPAFEEAYRRAGVLLENSSHCLGFSLMRATRERFRYLMQIYWDSPDGHLIGFRQSKDFREYQELLAPYTPIADEPGHYRKTGIELTKKQLVRISGPPR